MRLIARVLKVVLFSAVAGYVLFPTHVDSTYSPLAMLAVLALVVIMVLDGVKAVKKIKDRED